MPVQITAATYANRDHRKYLDSWSLTRKVCIKCKEIFEGRKFVRMCKSCRHHNNKIWSAVRN